MAGQFQTVSRTTRVSRFNKPGHRALAFINAWRPVALWDAALGITLNVTTVSAQADQSKTFPRPWQSVSFDVTQPSGANQPLYIGAATINGQPTVQFAAASINTLNRSNTRVFVGNTVSAIIVCALGATKSYVMCNCPDGTSRTSGVALDLGSSRAWECFANPFGNGVFHADGVAGTSPEIHIYAHGAKLTYHLNGALTALSLSSLAIRPPLSTDSISFGSLPNSGPGAGDVNIGLAAWFATELPSGVAQRISKALGARFGIAA